MKTGLRVALALVAILAGGFFIYRRIENRARLAYNYPAPRVPAHRFRHMSDDDIFKLARIAVRQTRNDTRLGMLQTGQHVLILIPPTQDMRVANAIGAALKERGVPTDFITEDKIFMGAFGNQDEANMAGRTQVGKILHSDGGVIDGSLEGYLWGWPQFLPEDKRQQGPKRAGNEHREAIAAKKYLDKHPEYNMYLGRSSLLYREWSEQEIGKRYLNNWHYETLADLIVQTSPFPDEVARLLEDRVLEVLPWVESVHVTEPEGTDIRFSLTEQQAEFWYKGAFEPPQIEVNPFAGTMGLDWREAGGKFIVPDFNGVIAGHAGHAGYYPTIKIHVEHGLARSVEGGGKLGELWKLYLSNPQLSNAHYPGTPEPGFLYLYQGELGIDPKVVTTGRPLAGRAGEVYWGFGLDAATPELEKYAEENHLPTYHGLHVHTFFPTYEAVLRGDHRHVKLTDKGHLTALDDPEVRALAARYGKADEVLQEEYIPTIPGINAPGNYQKDYAQDPLSFERRFWKQVLSDE